MAYRVKTYTLREEAEENGTRNFISFKDGQGGYHELEVSEQFFIEFRQMERRNRNLLQSDERHKEFFGLSDESLNKRARVTPKGVDEISAMEHCTASSVGKSLSIAKEKIKAQMKKYLFP